MISRPLAAYRAAPAIALLASVGAASTPAGAQLTAQGRARAGRPTSLLVEARFGPYRPRVDTAFADASPYRDTFGDGRRYMIGLEVDWQAVHVPHFGSLGVGGSVGYTAANGNARFANPNRGDSAETATLTIWPFAAHLVGRIDMLAKDFSIPLVPYGKLGVGVAYWSSSNGRGTSRDRSDGSLGRGHSVGLTYAGGLMLLLDVFDRQSAKTFDVELGVRHTYAFGELTVTDYSRFSPSGALRLGDRTWNVGLAFEM